MKSLDELKRLSGGTNTNGSPLLFHFTYGQLSKLVDIVREDAIDTFNREMNQACEEARLLDKQPVLQKETPTQGGLKSRIHELECGHHTTQLQGAPVEFEQWYEANAKYMTATDFKPWMSESWDAAIQATKENLYKAIRDAETPATQLTLGQQQMIKEVLK